MTFDAPEPPDGDCAASEKECFRTIARLVKNLRERHQHLAEAARQSERYWNEKEKATQLLNEYLVRNLIPIVDGCKLWLGHRPGVLAALRDASLPVDGGNASAPAPVPETAEVLEPTTADPPAETPIESAEPTPAAVSTEATDGENLARYVETILRSVLSLLNSLELYRVDLLGRTVNDVVVEGEAIEHPFVIEDAQEKGKATEMRVREVNEDLWVRRRHGVLEVARKGRVNC